MATILDMRCGDCGARLKEYEVYNRVTGEVHGTHTVCPNEWHPDHP